MADDAALGVLLIAVLLDEFLRAGEGDLVDVLVHLFGRHADAVIDEPQFALALVDFNRHAVVNLRVRVGDFALRNCVAAVGYDFSNKNIFIRIQPFLDDRHDILRMDGNVSGRRHIYHLVDLCLSLTL